MRSRRANRAFAKAEPRVLITRHPRGNPRILAPFLTWLEENVPEARAHLELRVLPFRPGDGYALHVPWLQDPVERWSRRVFDQAMAVTRALRARGVETINPVDRLAHAGKLEGARRMASSGSRTPRGELVAGPIALPPPFFVREDWGHILPGEFEGGGVRFCANEEEAAAFQPTGFVRPVALEYLDVRSPDGRFRKYRYFAAGELGVSHHMQTAENWWVKGDRLLHGDELREEECAFLDVPNPHHEKLQAARRSLELDLVAIDYSIDRDGELVIWEANPYPSIHLPSALVGRRLEHRIPSLERTLAAIAHLYLTRAGVDVPDRIGEYLSY